MANQDGPEILRKIFAPPPRPLDDWPEEPPPPPRRGLIGSIRGLLTAPLGHLSLRGAIVGLVVLVAFFGGTLWALHRLFPRDPMMERRPELAALPPLKPVTRASTIVAPVAVADLAIRDVLEARAPRDLSGKRDNPLSDILGKADIGWTGTRGPVSVTSAPPELNISAPIIGTLRVTGQIADKGGKITGTVSGLLGDSVARDVKKLTTRVLDQRADIRGSVIVAARPTLSPNWRIEPNLSGQVTVAAGGMTVAGVKINAANEVKPLLDRNLNEQIDKLSGHLRNDTSLERAVRRQWQQLCRSIALGSASGDAPDLWLEVRPTKAFAAQPRVVPDWVILTVGVETETRIAPGPTKPDCPFPAQLELVQQQLDQGNVTLAVPIEMPFNELTRVVEAQLKGKTFPDDGRSAGQVTVLAASLAASGDRLLISMRVRAKENKSWFGLGGEATVHVWGRPVIDQADQLLRLTDISLDVQSQAAFGLLGAAARAAIPYLQAALQQNAVIDLKPLTANARQSIEAALNEFRKPADGIEVEAFISGVRLAGVEFDSKTVRVIAEVQGTARALVRKIAVQ